MTRTESTVCWLGWGILALVSMYGCTGGTARADEIVARAIETQYLTVETPDLAEGWQSPIGLEVEFTQDGSDFAWRVNGSGQLGMGTVAGNVTPCGVSSARLLDARLAKKLSVSPTM